MALSREPSTEREELVDRSSSGTQTADSASVASRVLTELQSIQLSQRRMEDLLCRMLDDLSVSPSPDLMETSDPHSRSTSTLKDAIVQLKMKKHKVSAAGLWTDPDRAQGINSEQTTSSAQTPGHLSLIRPLTHVERQSSSERQDDPEYPRCFNSVLSRVLLEEDALPRQSGTSDLPPDAFIAATLPLSWPTVLVARSHYEKEKNLSTQTLIKNTAAACSRMGTVTYESTPLQARKWRRWRCTICPGSAFHTVMCCLSFIVLLFDVMTIPVILAWELPMTGLVGVTSILSTMFWTADLGLNFLTAFYVKGELVARPAAIAKRYFRTWFLFDFLGISGDWTSVAFESLASGSGKSSRVRLIRLVKVARLLRIIRVIRMLRFLQLLRESLEKQCFGYYRIAIKTVSLLLFIILLTHSLSCAWYAIGNFGISDTGRRWTDMFAGDSPVEYERLYQYVTSFHWAAAQLTLGATDVNSSNSMERSANIVCMLMGLIFSCTLVSSLSATLVDFSIAHKDQTQKMDAIRKYLKERYISATTCLLVEDQIWHRLREEKKGSVHEAESCMQSLLSQQLFARLRHEVLLPTINTHPFLRLWGSVHEPTMHRLAVEAFEFRVLQLGDDLFGAGGKASAAYFIIEGELEYTQRPDSSPELQEVKKTVCQGTWLCEAALWSEWIHVGTAVAKQRSTLALLKAEELLKVCSEHAVVKTIVTSYGETFHSKIVDARPPEESWPSDLVVPNTSLARIVMSMPKEAQVAIGWNVLRRCSEEPLGLTGWAAMAFHGQRSRQLERLAQEVSLGQSTVIRVGQEVQRVVSTACLRLLDERWRVLVQIGKGKGEAEGMDPVCQLPGHKLQEDAAAAEKLAQLLEAKLPLLTGNLLQLEQVETEEMQEVSPSFSLKTTYFRTIMTARFAGAWEADPVPLAWLDAGRQSSLGSQRMYFSSKAHSAADSMLLESLVQNEVYHVKDAKGESALYVWLPEEVFKELHANSSCHHLVTEWIRRLPENFPGHGTMPPELSIPI